MKKFVLIVLVAMAAACSSTKHSATSTSSSTQGSTASATADGTSFETAIVIQEKSEGKGISAEYKWIDAHYPGYKRKSQSLQTHDKKPYDVLTIETADGAEKKVYFDISNFFGKF